MKKINTLTLNYVYYYSYYYKSLCLMESNRHDRDFLTIQINL